jgi:hypothetical protein
MIIIKPLSNTRLSNIDLKISLPNSFWISNDDNNHYRVGYRSCATLLENKDCGLHLIKYSKQLENIGREVWVCVDKSNGNTDMYFGKIYSWIFKTQKEAQKQYLFHKNCKKFASLFPPTKYLVIDQIMK